MISAAWSSKTILVLLGVGRPVGLAMLAVGSALGAYAGWSDAVGLRPRSTEADREAVLGYVMFGGLVVGLGGLALPDPGNLLVPLAGFGVLVWSAARLVVAGWNDAAPEPPTAPSSASR